MDAMMTEEPIGFLRNNPFIKNDVGHRRAPNFRSVASVSQPKAPVISVPALKSVVSTVAPLPAVQSVLPTQTMTPVPQRNEPDTASLGSSSDVEYGPGIVERLRAKFNKLSGLATKEARVSPHATCKRCPSMDDILSNRHEDQNPPPSRGYETLDRSWGGGSSHTSSSMSSLNKEHSLSVGDVADRNEQKRRFVVHREVKYRDDDIDNDVNLPDISTLRRKFETNASRPNWENRRFEQIHATPAVPEPIPVPPPDYDSEEVMPTLMKLREEHSDMENRKNTYIRKELSYEEQRPSVYPVYKETIQIRDHTIRERRPISMDLSLHEIPLLDRDTPPPRTLKLTQPPQNRLRVLEVLNRADSQENEPEFVRIGRRLRRSSTSDDVVADHIVSPTPREEKRVTSAQPRRQPASIPTVSSSARIVPSHSMGHLASPSSYTMYTSQRTSIDTLMSPPDPDSARLDRPSIFSPQMSPIHRPIPPPESSPPPEEPMPPKPQTIKSPEPIHISPPADITKTEIIITSSNKGPAPAPPGLLVPKILPVNNDLSGMSEMQRLLNRFNTTRDKKIFEEENNEVPNVPRPNFIPAVTSVRTADGRAYKMSGLSIHTSTPPRPNVVSITVRDEAPQRRRNGDSSAEKSDDKDAKPFESVKRVAAPPPPVPTEAPPTRASDAVNLVKRSVPAKNEEDTRSSYEQVRAASHKLESNIFEAAKTISIVKSTNTSGNDTTNIVDSFTSIKQTPTTAPPAPIYDYRPTISAPPPPMNPPRKSLSAQYFESQGVTQKPYGDDVTEVKGVTAPDYEKQIEKILAMVEVEPVDSEQSDAEEMSEDLNAIEESQVVESDDDMVEHGDLDEVNVPNDIANHGHLSENSDIEPDSLEVSGDERDEIPNEAAIEAHLAQASERQMNHYDDSSDDENDDDPPINELAARMALAPPIMAGDGNPVRHSLMELVMDEDIPELLAAMSENYRFEFTDLNGNGSQPSTSSILHPPDTRKQRRTARKVGRISFAENHPFVFTYLDERTAERESSWTEGNKVTYDIYQSICEAEQEEQRKSLEEIEAWKSSLPGGDRLELEPEDDDSALGVTSRFLYSSHNENSTISV